MWAAVVPSLVSFFLLCASFIPLIGYLGNSFRVKMDWLFGEWNHRPLQEAKDLLDKTKIGEWLGLCLISVPQEVTLRPFPEESVYI